MEKPRKQSTKLDITTQGGDKLKLLKNLPGKQHNCHPTGMALKVKYLWKVCKVGIYTNIFSIAYVDN